MSEVPVQLIVAAFDDEKAADEALKALKQAKRERLIGIENAAVLRKDAKGKLHIRETADMGGGKGAVIGGVAGAAIGLLAGPLLVVPAAVGALVGGLAAKLVDAGFPNDRLKELGEGLKPGSSAIIAVVEHRWVDEIRREMEQAGADMMVAELKADIASQLEAGHDVAYSALAAQGAFSAERVVSGEEGEAGESILITEDAVVESQYVATEEGIVVRQVTETAEGVVDETLAATEDTVGYGVIAATEEGAVIGTVVGALEEGEEAEAEEAESSEEEGGEEPEAKEGAKEE
jgi:uncharacterized membrane protein